MAEPASDEEDLSEAVCGECLFDLLVDLKLRGVLFATDVCKIAYWAAMSGAIGPVKKLAKEPGDTSPGHYSDHFDRVVGISQPDPRMYYLDTPMFSKSDGCRMVKPLACLPPHELIATELSGIDNVEAKLADFVPRLPPTYRSHPVVEAVSPRIPVPLGLYVDGIQYATQNYVVGWFLVNYFTGRHHLICSVRKSCLCKCGCGGWDTVRPILEMLHWSFSILREGSFPDERHDKRAFKPTEGYYAAKAGLDCHRGACLYLKADLMEFGTTLGFPACGHAQHPCHLCFLPPDPDLFSQDGTPLHRHIEIKLSPTM